MFLLVLLLPFSHSAEDCIGGDWGNWSSECGETQVPLLTSQRVGERIRERVRLGGEHCLRSDLIEVRLCRLGVIEPKDTVAVEDTSGEDLREDPDRHETKGTNTTMVTSGQPASNLIADNQASKNTVTESTKADPPELSILGTNRDEVPNLPGRTREPAIAASAHHLTHHVTERSTLITLLALCLGMLGGGAVVGAVLVRKHRQLQFRHHVLVRTRSVHLHLIHALVPFTYYLYFKFTFCQKP